VSDILNMENIEKMVAEIEAAKAKMIEEGKKVLTEGFKAYLDKYPQVGSLTWSQYTPYFNDGDSCVFSRNDIYALPLAKQEGDEDDDEDDYPEGRHMFLLDYDIKEPPGEKNRWTWKDRPYKPVPGMTEEEVKQAAADLALFEKIPDEVFLDVFDDHVEVTVTRDGIDVEEYSHD